MNTTALDELQWKSPEWIQSFGLRTDNVLDYFAESPFFDKTSNNHVIKMQRQFSTLPPNNNNNSTSSNSNSDGLVLPTGDNNNNSSQTSSAVGGGSNEFYYLDPMRQDIMNRYPIHANIERELSKLSGIEYVLIAVREPDFWVIRKQYRRKVENNNMGSINMDMNNSKRFTFEILKDYYIVGANVYQSPSIYKVIKNRLMSTTFHLSKTIENIYKLTHFEPLQGVQFKQVQQQQQQRISQQENNNGLMTPSIANNSTTSISTMVNTTNTASTTVVQSSPFDSTYKEVITSEMMDRLLTTSIKSEPEYI